MSYTSELNQGIAWVASGEKKKSNAELFPSYQTYKRLVEMFTYEISKERM